MINDSDFRKNVRAEQSRKKVKKIKDAGKRIYRSRIFINIQNNGPSSPSSSFSSSSFSSPSSSSFLFPPFLLLRLLPPPPHIYVHDHLSRKHNSVHV